MKRLAVLISMMTILLASLQAQIGSFNKLYSDSVFSRDYRFRSLPNYSIYNALNSITSGDQNLSTPPGTTTQRPTVPSGKIILRFNTDSNALEYGNSSQVWKTLTTGSTQIFDTSSIPNFYLKVRSLFSVASPLQYNAITGNLVLPPATSTQSGYIASSDWVVFNSRLPDPGSNGIVVRTASGITASRQLVPASSNVSIVNPTGVSGNPSIDINDTLLLKQLQLPYIPSSLSAADSALFLNRSTGFLEVRALNGGGINNSNVGSGYRLLNSYTQTLRTFIPGFGQKIDSTVNTNSLTLIADTSALPSKYYVDSSTNSITASNGLTKTANIIQLGGLLTKSDTLDVSTSYSLQFLGSGTSAPLRINQSGAGIGAFINTFSGTGTGLSVQSNNATAIQSFAFGTGYGASLQSVGNIGAYIATTSGVSGAAVEVNPASTNSAQTILQLKRYTSGTGANGIAGRIEFITEPNTNTVDVTSGYLESGWEDATFATRKSYMAFHTTLNGVTARKFNISSAGQLTADQYTGTNFQTIDTSYNSLVVDGSGNVFKRAGGNAGGGGSGITSLTGPVTATGPGAAASSITNNAIDNAMIRQSAGLSVIGTAGNSTANVADITAATDNQILRRNGTSIGFGALNLASANAVTGILPNNNLDTPGLKNIYLPLFLTGNKTINQGGNNIFFTGGGETKSDSFKLSTLNGPPVVTGLVALGHSIMYGQGASVTDSSLKQRDSRYYGLPLSDLSLSGSGIWRAASNFYLNINPGHSNVTIVMGGLNDVRRNGWAATTHSKLINGYNAIFVNQYLSSWVPGGDASVTKVGTWGAGYTGSTVGGKDVNSGIYSTTINDTAKWTFTGTNCVVGLMGADGVGGSSYNYAKGKIYIDGVLVKTFDATGQWDGVSDGVYDNKRGTFPLFFTGLSAGSHTVAVVQNDAGRYLVIDYFGTLVSPAAGKPLILYHDPYLTTSGYTTAPNLANNSILDSLNTLIDSLKSVYVGLGYPVYRVPTNSYYNTSTGTGGDGIHPNDLGYLQMFEGTTATVSTFLLPASSGTVYYTNNGKVYLGQPDGTVKALAFDGDTSSYIRNQITNTQTGGFKINGTGTVGTIVAPAATLGNISVAAASGTLLNFSPVASQTLIGSSGTISGSVITANHNISATSGLLWVQRNTSSASGAYSGMALAVQGGGNASGSPQFTFRNDGIAREYVMGYDISNHLFEIDWGNQNQLNGRNIFGLDSLGQMHIAPPANATNGDSVLMWRSSDSSVRKISSANLITVNDQVHSSGTSVTISNGVTRLFVDPASALASLAITFPSAPYDGQVIKILFGGTITSSASDVVTGGISSWIASGSGFVPALPVSSTPIKAGTVLIFEYRAANTLWYQTK